MLAAEDNPIKPVKARGSKDVRSADLGDKSGWIGKKFVGDLASDIQEAVLTDGLLLRAMHQYEQLSRQGAITLEPANDSGIDPRSAERGMQVVQDFLSNVHSPYGEGWEDLYFKSVLELAVFANFAMELVWDGKQIVNMDLLPWGSLVELVDKKGVPFGWVQFDYYQNQIWFTLAEICHGHLNRWPGDRYGTPTLAPVSGDDGDLRAFRSIEALAGKQAEQLTFPYQIINFGTENRPVQSDTEQAANEALVEDMLRHGTLIGNGQVKGEVLEATGKDLDGTLKHWMRRAVVPTGKSLPSLGIAENINVATAEVLDSQESQNQLAVSMAAASSWRQTIFAWVLYVAGLPAELAPYIVPGEPNPVRREKAGKHAQSLGNDGYLTRNEVRRANGYTAATDEQARELDEYGQRDRAGDEPTEPEDRREERQEERTQ